MAFKYAIEQLQKGEVALIRPKGNSMVPIIKSGDEVLLIPVLGNLAVTPTGKYFDPKVGDVVLAKVGGSVYLHKISAIDGDRVQISNNKGHVNGWTTFSKVYGLRWK